MLTPQQIAQFRGQAGLSPTAPPTPANGANDIIAQRKATLGIGQPTSPVPAPQGSSNNPNTFQSPLQNISSGNSQTNLEIGKGAIKQAVKDFSSAGAQNAGPIGADMMAHAPAFAQDINALNDKTKPSNPAQAQGASNTSMAELAIPSGEGARVATEAINPILEASKASRIASDAKAVDNLAGQIIQGTTKDIAKAKSALGNIVTTGIKTYKDLASVLTDKISTISNKLDETLATNTETKPLADLTHTFKVGESDISHNYVQDALDQLKSHYQATNDVAGLEKITQLETKAGSEGLTVKEVNDLAKEHGNTINAFNANGQAASGLTKQAAENTRTGIKATAREMFGNNPVFKAADSQLTNLIRTRDLVSNVAENVNKLQQKIQARGLGEKVGRLVGEVMNVVGLNSPKGFIEYFLGRGTGLKTLNALDLEKGLARNLKNLQGALAPGATEADVESHLQQIIDDAHTSKSGTPKISSQSLDNASKGSPTTMQNADNASQTSMNANSSPNMPDNISKTPEKSTETSTASPAPESALSFLKNNITSQKGFVKNPFADTTKAVASVAKNIGGKDISLIQDFMEKPNSLETYMKLQPVLESSGLDKMDIKELPRFFQKVINERNAPEFGESKFDQNPSTGKMRGSTKK